MAWGWGLMFQKWFDHNGQLDLNMIATYLKELDVYFLKRKSIGPRNIWTGTLYLCAKSVSSSLNLESELPLTDIHLEVIGTWN